jgi:hypothetical protein
VREFFLPEQRLEFLAGLADAFGVSGVDDVDEGVSVGEVVGPVLPEGPLPTDIPDIEPELVMGEVLDVEALGGGDGADVLSGGPGTSLARDFKIVVLPALSRPSTNIRSSSFLFFRRLRKIPISPPPWF